VPPPTPVHFPRCFPEADEDGSGPASGPASGPRVPLVALLQGIIRPTEVGPKHFEALGIHVRPDSGLADLIPDPDFVPDFEKWDSLSYEEARQANEGTRRRLNNGNLSPGVHTYHDRKLELCTNNIAAYSTVRRLQPPPGRQAARLGNAYEFFKNLETFAVYWDDTSVPKPEPPAEGDGDKEDGSNAPTNGANESKAQDRITRFNRVEAGTSMPAESRLSLVTAFIKLVAYDFNCNVSAPRTEPRLYLNAAPLSSPAPETPPPLPRSSYFSSGCIFVFRSPQTREAARAGIVEGPLVAVTARHTTGFPPPPSDSDASSSTTSTDRDSAIDLAREIIAALLTAQHRAREGRSERRFGEKEWWATKPRWGGGPGGPIGREADPGAPPNTDDAPPEGSAAAPRPNRAPAPKKARRNLPAYDGYRMVRPPSAGWDKKTRYSAVGRVRGADYDDVFIVSALFHHISFLRVRVPQRLLDVLDGVAPDVDEAGRRAWGRVEVVRSPWFDFFLAQERVAAMRIVWAMMGYLMRAQDDGDVEMAG